MPDTSPKLYRPIGPEILGAVTLALFSIPALVFGCFLTVLKFKLDERCDEFFQHTCKTGCTVALSDPWSTVWGIPLSAYATGFYFVLTMFGLVVGLWPRDLAPSARFPVLVLTLAGLALSALLGLYAWLGLHTLCEYCALLYLASFGVFLAARLLNPEGVFRGLLNGARRIDGIGVMLIVVALAAFSAVVLVQKRLLDDYARDSTTQGCIERRINTGEELPTTSYKLPSSGPIEVAVLVFIDFACPHCKTDFEFWRRYQEEHQFVQVEFLHFSADPVCGPLESSVMRRSQSCNAALALECLREHKPGDEIRHMERIFAMQSLSDPFFSRDHIRALGEEMGVPDIIPCMDTDVMLRRVRQHIQFGMSKGLRSPPSVFMVPVRDGKPLGYSLQYQGSKSAGFADLRVKEVRSWREKNE